MPDNTADDTLKRASADHEAFGWRSRFWICSFTRLDRHVPYRISSDAVAYMRLLHQDSMNDRHTRQLVDIYHSGTNLEDAILVGSDRAELLTNLLAVLGYGPAVIVGLLSTCRPTCVLNKPFHLAAYGGVIRNDAVPVHPNQFPAHDLEDVELLSLNHLNDGLNARLPTVGFAAFWNALEVLADEQARKDDKWRMGKCKNKACEEEWPIGPDTRHYFEAMYEAAEVRPSPFDNHRKRRAKIQHGNLISGSMTDAAVRGDAKQLQKTALLAVSKRTGLVPVTNRYLSNQPMVIVFTCLANTDRTFAIKTSQWSTNPLINVLPKGMSGTEHRSTAVFGENRIAQFDPLAFPPIADA